jgi:excinuclease ABC subunit A
VRDLTEDIKLDRYFQHTIEIIVDRLVSKPGIDQRLTQSLETALNSPKGWWTSTSSTAPPHLLPGAGVSGGRVQLRGAAAPQLLVQQSVRGLCGLFRDRHPLPGRSRTGVPNPDLSIRDGAVHPWSGRNRMQYFQRMLEGLSDDMGFDIDAPWAELSRQGAAAVLGGTGSRKVKVTYTNRFGRKREYSATYEGILPWLGRRHEGAESDGAREYYQEYMREVPCDTCGGARLNPVARAVTVGATPSTRWRRCRCGTPAASSTACELTERETRSPSGC